MSTLSPLMSGMVGLAAGRGDYIPCPTHDGVVDRLVGEVQGGGSRVCVMGPRGSGKSTVVGEALRRLAGSRRPMARVQDPADATDLAARLAGVLSGRTAPLRDLDERGAWRALTDAMTVAAWRGKRWILVVEAEEGRETVASLVSLGRLVGGQATVIAALGLEAGGELVEESWVGIGVEALALSDSVRVAATLAQRQGLDPTRLSPEAYDRLHLMSGGSVGELKRMALEIARRAGGVEGVIDGGMVEEWVGWAQGGSGREITGTGPLAWRGSRGSW